MIGSDVTLSGVPGAVKLFICRRGDADSSSLFEPTLPSLSETEDNAAPQLENDISIHHSH